MRSRILAAALTVFFGLLSIGPALAAGGQFGNLSGTITDAQTHAPIAGATVFAKSGSGSYTAKTDASGHYSILGMNVDTYTLTITAQGYEPQSFTGVIVFGDENDVANEVITKQLKTIAHVTSTAANSAFQPNQTIDTYTVSGQRIQQALGNPFSTNEADLVQSAPGVVPVFDNGTTSISIRGSLSVELGYQYDSVPFTAPFFDENGSQGFLNGINGGSGGSLQIVSGAGDATQGNVGGGIINTVVPRGGYPASGDLDAEVGGPWYQHNLNFDYSLATANGKISDYVSFAGNSFVPQGFPTGVPAAVFGQYFGDSYERHNDFVNNFVFRFGKHNNQSIQFLYRTAINEIYGNLGGCCAGLQHVATNPTFLDSDVYGTGLAMAPTLYGCGTAAVPSCASGSAALAAANAYYSSLIPDLPDENPNSPITSAPLTANNPMRFIKLAYTNSLNPSTFLTLTYYNWSLDSIDANDTTFSYDYSIQDGYSDIGGSRTGGMLSLTHEFGDNDTLTFEGKYEGARPEWIGDYPGFSTVALQLGAVGASVAGISPMQWAAPIGGACPYSTAAPTYGCYVYDNTVGKGESMPQIPNLGIGYNGTIQQQYGYALRDQWQPTDKLTFDIGARVDGENNKFGQTPFNGPGGTTSDVSPGYLSSQFLTPREFEPRAAVSWRLDRDDSLRFSYGRSTLFFFGQTLGTPFSVYPGLGYSELASIPATTGSLCGSGWHGPGAGYSAAGTNSSGATAYYFACQNYASQFFWGGDQILDAPDVGGNGPPTYSNFDLAWSHLFNKGIMRGWSSRITGYTRRGFNVEQNIWLLSGGINPITGQSNGAVFTVKPDGEEKTAGIEAQLTTPDVRPGQAGLSGFITFDYINELTNTPPVAGSSTLPILTQGLLTTGELFRAGWVSPVSAVIGGTYHFKHGTTITPTVYVNEGFPTGAGKSSLAYVNGVLEWVPQDNYAGLPFNGPIEPSTSTGNSLNATYYVDPDVPGSTQNPNIAGSRGYNEPAVAGGALTPPQAIVNLNIEQPVGNRFTLGVQFYNLFDYHYNPALLNTLYQAAGYGVSGPQTGLQPGYAEGVTGYANEYYPGGATLPFYPGYSVGTTWNVYLRAKL